HCAAIDQLRRQRRGKLMPSMAKAGARHHRKHHEPYCAGGPGMEPRAYRPRGRPQDRGAEQDEADRHEGVANVENENETIGERTPAGPPPKPPPLAPTPLP